MKFPKLTEPFFAALKISCAWWLDKSETHDHPCFKQDGLDRWLTFCKNIVRVKYLEACEEPIFHQVKPSYDAAFFTGYYEPTLYGSRTPTSTYHIPLYKLPHDKFYPRSRIRTEEVTSSWEPLVYVNDAVDAFFLEIQGSGRIILPDGTLMRVGYAGQNGYPFTPIGRILVERGEIGAEQISLFSIKEWLRNNYDRAVEIMDLNASYVFFKENAHEGMEPCMEDVTHGPIGTQGLPLTPMHSVACDPSYWPFGIVLTYRLTHPITGKDIYNFALTQDTGGAIKGKYRFDLFTGHGDEAQKFAGYLKHNGILSVFLP